MQARDVTDTRLEILGERVEFSIKSCDGHIKFVHTFVVCSLTRCSSGILCMDFLQQVGAGISLTSHSLSMDCHTFPFTDREGGTPTDPRLANGDQEGLALAGTYENILRHVTQAQGGKRKE